MSEMIEKADKSPRGYVRRSEVTGSSNYNLLRTKELAAGSCSRSDFEMAGNFSCFLVCGLRRYPHEYPAVDSLSLNIFSYYWMSNIEKAKRSRR